MQEFLVTSSIFHHTTNFYSLTLMLVGLVIGAIVTITDLRKAYFPERRNLVHLIVIAVVFGPFIVGLFIDAKINEREQNPKCQVTLTSDSGQVIELKYPTSSAATKKCFKEGTKVLRLELSTLGKGTFYMESGISGPALFIKD